MLNNRKLLYIIFAFAAMFSVMFLTPEVAGLTPVGKKALGIAAFAIIMWVTQAVEDALSGFLIIFLLAVSGAAKVTDVFGGYASTSLWLTVVGFVMAGCMEKSGLSKRIALILLNRAKGSASNIYWAVALVMAVLSFLVPSITARTLLMLPIILGIGQAFNAVPGRSNIVKALLFIVAMSGTMMSIGILTAHVGNPVTVGLIQKATGQAISWSRWFVVGGPPAFLLAFISIFAIKWMWPPETETLGEGTLYVQEQLREMGPFSKGERSTLIIFLLTLILWATDSIHKVDVVIVGTFAVLLLLWPQFGIMTWKEAQQKVPWNVFILYGAGLSMGSALVSSGVAKWLAGAMFGPIAIYSQAMQVVIMIWIVTALQVLFTGGGPKSTALTPIIIAHSVTIGADPVVLPMILGMNMQHQYLLPVSNMPNAVAMGTGYLSSTDLIKTGLVMSLLAASFMSAMVFTYWKWIGCIQ